jgi:predicted unusual protein kinase regulating ubiquinone biosynthesis (AarF/ABC1/UbiB family)
VLVRRLGRLALSHARGRPVPEDELARAVSLVFQDLGTTFVKFGQLVASSPGVFGEGFANEFRSCLDTGPAVPFETVRATVESTLGRPLSETFASFEETPIGRASVAVVHRAVLHDGRVVAVKVLRPRVENAIAVDLRVMQPLFRFLAGRIGIAAAGQMVRLLDGFSEQVAEELDLRNEARAMEHFRRLQPLVPDLAHIVIPEPLPALSGQRVLTMDFLDGVPIDDLARVAELGVDPRSVMEEMVRGWFVVTLRDGVFHGDVHAGNMLFLRDGRVGVVDWGIVGRLDPRAHHFLRRTIAAALGDDAAWADVARELVVAYGPALEAGLGLDEAGLADFIREVMQPMLTRPFGEVSLGTFLAAIQGQVGTVRNGPGRAGWRERLRAMRRQREMHAGIERQGAIGTSFDRGTFLLAKQLLYFERYGRMFLPDVSIISDRDFFATVMRAAPLAGMPS